VLGCDFAGTVEEVCGAPSNGLKMGDRVAGLVHGAKFTDVGSYAEYLKVEHDLLIKLPDHLSFEQGASYGLTFMTAVHVSLALRFANEAGNGTLTSPCSSRRFTSVFDYPPRRTLPRSFSPSLFGEGRRVLASSRSS